MGLEKPAGPRFFRARSQARESLLTPNPPGSFSRAPTVQLVDADNRNEERVTTAGERKELRPGVSLLLAAAVSDRHWRRPRGDRPFHTYGLMYLA